MKKFLFSANACVFTTMMLFLWLKTGFLFGVNACVFIIIMLFFVKIFKIVFLFMLMQVYMLL